LDDFDISALLDHLRKFFPSRRRSATLRELLESLPILDDVSNRLTLLCHLRLYPVLLSREAGVLPTRDLQFLEFLRCSLSVRMSHNRSLLRHLVSESNCVVRPLKFAVLLSSDVSLFRYRYYRDLDLEVAKTDLEEFISTAERLNVYPGEIDPVDWNRYLLTQRNSSRQFVLDGREMHCLHVQWLDNEPLRKLFEGSRADRERTPECQFYGFVNGAFVIRTFVDVHYSADLSVHSGHSPEQAYFLSLAENADRDVRMRKRISISQLLEIEWLATNKNSVLRVPGGLLLSALLDKANTPTLEAAQRFVREKVALIQE
jgi:hypothetical protein